MDQQVPVGHMLMIQEKRQIFFFFENQSHPHDVCIFFIMHRDKNYRFFVFISRSKV